MDTLTYKKFIKLIVFAPLLVFIGKRSPISWDEGYYILQSKWILLTNDWISPTYWGNLALDRTIAIQYLIALSQKIFGQNDFAIYIPSMISGIIMLFLTSKIHKELIGDKNQIFSVLILSTTFLWINYFHMATQDITFSAIITFGIFSTIKAVKNNKSSFIFFSGIWIGLAVMLKTYLMAIPLLAIIPLLIKTKIIKNKYFWMGTLVGFLPFALWSYNIISTYGYETFSGLYSKLLRLSKNNNFTNPFYYYLWNLPANTFPWSLFSIIGFLNISKFNKLTHYFLFKYPLLIMLFLSIFSTKTPYYPIQILSLISINSYLGLDYIYRKRNFFTNLINKLYFYLFPLILIFAIIYLNILAQNSDIYIPFRITFSIVLLSFSLFWLISRQIKSFRNKFLLILLGPYLLLSVSVQSGVLNDRSKDIRIVTQEIAEKEDLKNKKVEFVTNGPRDESSTSKMIRIAIFTPKIGQGIKNIENLNKNQYAWTTFSVDEIVLKKEYEVVANNEILYPWKLIYKK